MEKFNYFPNHGDEDGRNSWTICYGKTEDSDHIIVGAEDTKKSAIEACKRLNGILKEKKALAKEAQKLFRKLFKHEKFGENEDCERIDDILSLFQGINY